MINPIEIKLNNNNTRVIVKINDEEVVLEDGQVRELIEELISQREHAKNVRNGFIAYS
jgi:hypothetical protein